MSILKNNNQRTKSRELIEAVVDNAEIASVGSGPGLRDAEILYDCADARRWFMDMEFKEFGDYDPDKNEYAGFCAGYCLDWLGVDRDAYMSDLVKRWVKSDEVLGRMVSKHKKQIVRKRSSKTNHSGRSLGRDRQALRSLLFACNLYTESVRRYREMFNV